MELGVRFYTLPLIALALVIQAGRTERLQPAVNGWATDRIEERLDRGIVAMLRENGDVYVGWRLLKDDPVDIAFNVYRATKGGKPSKLNSEPITATTDCVDRAPGDVSQVRYWVRPVVDGEELGPSKQAVIADDQASPYIAIGGKRAPF